MCSVGVGRRVRTFQCTMLVFLNLDKHAKPFRYFCGTPFSPNTTESKNGLNVSDDFRRTPETAPSNPWGSIEPMFDLNTELCS